MRLYTEKNLADLIKENGAAAQLYSAVVPHHTWLQ